MLSSVYISGRLGDRIDEKFRYVEIDRLLQTDGHGNYIVDKIPVRSMVNGKFYTAKNGTLIILKGRLEMNEKHGLIIVDEIDEFY